MKKLVLFTLVGALLFALLSGCSAKVEPAPVSIVAATDLHFAGREFHTYTGAFQRDSESNGSGKQMQYLDDILDAFIDQMLAQKPDYILLTGDLTYVGSKASHEALAQRLSALKAAGIQVLVVPGNHDITSATYILPEGEPVDAPSVTPQEFREIYADHGYNGALSYDKNSLSYVYDTGKGSWIFMLDTNFQYGATFGELHEETMSWLKSQLKRCKKAGAYPLLAGHHNLLVHNDRFRFGYVLGNCDALLSLAKQYGGDLYLSGHIHTQHIAREDGMTDIAGGSFAVYPHRYGTLTVNGSQWEYTSQATNVSAYAKQIGSADPCLLQYEQFGFQFFYDRAFEQAKESLSDLISDADILSRLCDLIARANVNYFGGTPSAIDLDDVASLRPFLSDTRWGDYLDTILDGTEDSIHADSMALQGAEG